LLTIQNHATITHPYHQSLHYIPTRRSTDIDTFTYKATDGQGVSSNTATVTITVNAVQNNPPTADNKTISTNAGTPVTITLTGTDPIPGDTLKFSVVAMPQHGTLTAPSSNTVTYTPNAAFTGTDTFTYKATDGQGLSSNTSTVNIPVNVV